MVQNASISRIRIDTNAAYAKSLRSLTDWQCTIFLTVISEFILMIVCLISR